MLGKILVLSPTSGNFVRSQRSGTGGRNSSGGIFLVPKIEYRFTTSACCFPYENDRCFFMLLPTQTATTRRRQEQSRHRNME